jgi:hypothetical protein
MELCRGHQRTCASTEQAFAQAHSSNGGWLAHSVRRKRVERRVVARDPAVTTRISRSGRLRPLVAAGGPRACAMPNEFRHAPLFRQQAIGVDNHQSLRGVGAGGARGVGACRREVASRSIETGRTEDSALLYQANDPLRDGCLTATRFLSIADARGKIQACRGPIRNSIDAMAHRGGSCVGSHCSGPDSRIRKPMSSGLRMPERTACQNRGPGGVSRIVKNRSDRISPMMRATSKVDSKA